MNRFSNKLIVCLIICTISILIVLPSLAQPRAGLVSLEKAGVKLSHLPGAYDSSFVLRAVVPPGRKVEFKKSDQPQDEESEDDEGDEIELSEWSESVMLDQTAVVTARITNQDGTYSDTLYYGTYLFGRASTLPVISLHLDYESFMGSDGIMRGSFEEVGEGVEKEFVYTGRVWDKYDIPILFEFLKPGEDPYAAPVRIQPFGGMTLGYAEKSMRIFTDTAIGPKRVKVDPFYNKRHKSYKSIVFRTSGNDYCHTRMKDMTLSSIARDLGVDYLDYCPSILYINGTYWGIYNMREKCNEEYLKYNHDAPKDSTTILVRGSGAKVPEYMELMEYVEQEFPEGMAIDSVNTKMDLENYINYIIWQIHITNIDSRGNVRYWKSSSLDNRWRWVFFDSDLGCSLDKVNFNYLRQRLRTDHIEWYNPEWCTRLLRGLVSHPEIRDYFINQYCYLMSTKLHKDTIINRIDYFANILRPEIPAHVKRRNSICGGSERAWENNVQLFKQFFEMREGTAFEHIMESFDLNDTARQVQWGSDLKDVSAVRLANTISYITSATTAFFPEIPVTLEARPELPKYVFKNWNSQPDGVLRFTLRSDSVNSAVAHYKRREASKIAGKLVCNFVYTYKRKKKDPLYIMGFRIDSLDNLDRADLKIMTNDEGLVENVRLDSMLQYNTLFVTNDTLRARKVVRGQRVVQIADFRLPKRLGEELVIWDDQKGLLDTISISIPDSLLKSDVICAARNLGDSAWSFNRLPVIAIPAFYTWWTIDRIISGVGFLLVLLTGIIIWRRRRKEITIGVIMLFAFNQVNGQESKDRFGLDSAQVKLINNLGIGYDSLSGLRNLRVVLRNVLYRSGNNHPESFRNPLELTTLENLREEGFGHIYYLYDRNFVANYTSERLDSLQKAGITYSCEPTLDSITVRKFLEEIYGSCNNPGRKLTLIHCWNGWHQSGWLSTLTLRQFCDYSIQDGLAYWVMNTDGNHKGYEKVKRGISEFKPYPDLKLTEAQKREFCPCVKFDSLALAEAKRPIDDSKKEYSEKTSDSKLYIVKKGDTLSGIAEKTRVPMRRIMHLNGLKKNSILQICQKLKIG
ncbi:MAG: CotH kinase family protein [Bacteroidota bacterium]